MVLGVQAVKMDSNLHLAVTVPLASDLVEAGVALRVNGK